MGRKFGREMCGVLPFRSDKTDTLYPTMSAVPNLVGARGLLATSWLALRAVAGATFSRFARVEPPAPGGSHPHELQMQKSLLAEQAFRIWSVIEDSNLRPLRPERSALPAAPITECGAHLTAQIRPRQSLNSKMPFDRRESQQAS